MNHMTADGKTPWDDEIPYKEIEVTVFLTLRKTFKVNVNDYHTYIENNEEFEDFSDCDLHKAVDEQVTLPHELAVFIERMFEHDLDLKAAKMPKYLKDSIEDCKDWEVDDFEIFKE